MAPPEGTAGPRGQLKLTLTVGPIVGDEDGQVVGRGVAALAGAVVAAKRVVAGGARTADFISPYLTFIFVYETARVNQNIVKVPQRSVKNSKKCTLI